MPCACSTVSGAGRSSTARAASRPVDHQALAAAITALSELAIRHPEIEDLDLNPVFAGPDGVVVVDWLMRVR